MSHKDEQPDTGLDDFDKAARLNFRDYPSTALVMIAAVSSGLGWIIYKWVGRRRAVQPASPNNGEQAEGNVPEAGPPADESA